MKSSALGISPLAVSGKRSRQEQDAPKLGRLLNRLWRRLIELFLLAGRTGYDSALRPVEELAWALRLLKDMLIEELHSLAETGVVHAAQAGARVVTNFAKRQSGIRNAERSHRYRGKKKEGAVTKRDDYRHAYRHAAGVASSTSTSTSTSDSISDSFDSVSVSVFDSVSVCDSDSGSDVDDLLRFPETPAGALRHPDAVDPPAARGDRAGAPLLLRTSALHPPRGKPRIWDNKNMISTETEFLAFLDQHQFEYRYMAHEPVFTCAEAEQKRPDLPGVSTKNLFLCDKKARRFFLVTTACEKQMDLARLARRLGVGKLHFASGENLKRLLGVTRGAVTLLGLVNDTGHQVELWVDARVWESDTFLCHPLVNTATLVLSKKTLERFFSLTGHTLRFFEAEE